MSEYDFGFIATPENGKGVKVTMNLFRNQWYVHLREYIEDGDTGEWYPTKKGLAIKAENIDVVSFMLNQAGNLFTDIYYDELYGLIEHKQLNLFEDTI